MQKIDAEIFRLAIPAFGALVSQPIFLLTDTALVGHLGTTQLAALGIAANILTTFVGLCGFLAYAATPIVAKFMGAGDRSKAISAGINGIWFAFAISIIIVIIIAAGSNWLLGQFSPTTVTYRLAHTYLIISLIGIPAVLMSTAATGLLRGLHNTRTPLWITVGGFSMNIVANAILIYPAHCGVAGSAYGTVLSQWLMGIVFIGIIFRLAHRHHISLFPHKEGLSLLAIHGGWLAIRGAMQRITRLFMIKYAAGIGVIALGSLQIDLTLLSTSGYALDALTIAAQAMVGKSQGEFNTDRGVSSRLPSVSAQTWNIIRRLIFWSILCGLIFLVFFCTTFLVLGRIFTSDYRILMVLPWLLLLTGISIPIGGYVFVMDGILIGYAQTRYCALASIVNASCAILWGFCAVNWTQHESIVIQTLAVLSMWCIAYLGMRTLSSSLGLMRIHSRVFE